MPDVDESPPGLNYASVQQYWEQVPPSTLGPYMMHGFGFPCRAGLYRFRMETKIMDSLVEGMDRDGAVLDLGCGVGHWSEYFAHKFESVIAVESSTNFFDALQLRCSPYKNVGVVLGNVMEYQPQEKHSLVFLGGMLMYLNESDAMTLLRKIIPFLNPNGMILCRESNIREGSISLQGDYQAVYRSIATYQRIFNECGLSVVRQEVNSPYVLMQMGCELIKGWKRIVPARIQCLPLVGGMVYWGLRLGESLIPRLLKAFGVNFPKLTNHFFLLQPTTTQS
jgi:ubiquinone/menaquinone biosynthesis C-methylase UbiE